MNALFELKEGIIGGGLSGSDGFEEKERSEKVEVELVMFMYWLSRADLYELRDKKE